MKQLLIFGLLALSTNSFSAPSLVSDPTAQTVTACGILLDAAAKVEIPVTKDATGAYCKYDLSSVATGVHTIKATFINIDPLWGRLESVPSVPFSFTRPSLAVTPDGLAIKP